MKVIKSDKAPNPVGAYSQAIDVGNMVFVSGQIPINSENNEIVTREIKIQTKQVLENIKFILSEARLLLENVVKVEIFLADMNDFNSMNEIYARYFTGLIKPARQAVEVARLPLDVLVEMSCIAIRIKG